MISQGATVAMPCADCGALALYHLAEHLVHGRVEWTLSIRCPACGNAIEEDGWGTSPELIRDALVDEHGRFRIEVRSPSPSAAELMRVLRRESPDMTLAEAKASAQRLRGGQVRGTRVEMEQLAERLRAAGFIAEVEAMP
jgi:hypothetical protein